MSRHVVVRSPARLDFGGGWTDVPPFCDEEGGFVCNVAIQRYATVRVGERQTSFGGENPEHSERPEAECILLRAVARRFNAPALDIHLSSDFPLGAGLGGSSAAGVAAIAALAAWQGRVYELDQLAETSRAIETGELGIAGGRQDHYAAAYGGALALKFGTRVEVRRLRVDGATRGELARRGILIYTGQSRISGDTISAVLDAYRRADPTVVRALRRMRELAQQMPEALERGNLDWLGSLVAEQWAAQRTLHPGIATPRIDAIIDRAVRAGAVGAKALGASGGGCVLVIAMSNRVPEVREAIAPLGELLEYEVDTGGVARCG